MNYNKLLFFCIFCLILLGLAEAIGVGSPYSLDTPLKLYPGEEKIVFLDLQNPDIEGGVTLKGEILEGSEIASLEKSQYEVPYQGKETVKLTVRVPQNANPGSSYSIVYEFKQISGVDNGGMVSFSQGLKRRFDVEIIGDIELEETSYGIVRRNLVFLIFSILLSVILLGAILYLFKKRKINLIYKKIDDSTKNG